jgi:hypothetical protein
MIASAYIAVAMASNAIALSVSVPSPRDLFDNPCVTFRLPPKAVNGTFLNQITVEQPWIEPPFGFGYGKWALAWTTIEEYWGWSNMQVGTDRCACRNDDEENGFFLC